LVELTYEELNTIHRLARLIDSTLRYCKVKKYDNEKALWALGKIENIVYYWDVRPQIISIMRSGNQHEYVFFVGDKEVIIVFDLNEYTITNIKILTRE